MDDFKIGEDIEETPGESKIRKSNSIIPIIIVIVVITILTLIMIMMTMEVEPLRNLYLEEVTTEDIVHLEESILDME